MFSEKSHEGRYAYCIVGSNEETDFGQIGIENSFIYTLPARNIGAVIHRCETKFYETKDKEKAAEWFLTHQYVIDLATKEFGTVIPLTFNTIFIGDDETVKKWLNEHYGKLETLLEKLEGKEQYRVQIFIENGLVRKVVEENEEVQRLRKEIQNNPRGAAFLFKKQREKSLILVKYYARNLYYEIKELIEEVRLEPTNKEILEKWRDKLMILNLSCLVHKNEIENLRNMLGEVNKREGFDVVFTGPWPPYSFVKESKSQGG